MNHRKGETSYHETALGIIPRSKLILLEIEGIKRAWDFVLRQRARAKVTITPDSLKKIHFISFGWIFPDWGGKFRIVDVEVSNHRPPAFFHVPQYMLDFCRDLKERLRHLPSMEEQKFVKELIELLAWVHHRFLWIHPFKDYNGRLARLLTNIILLNLDLPPAELRVETKGGREKYINALEQADKGNYKLLENLIEDALQEAAREI